MILYHGSKEIVEYPEIRRARFNKDFYFGFYCTNIEKQAERWATRYGEEGYINKYEYTENTELKILKFEKRIYNGILKDIAVRTSGMLSMCNTASSPYIRKSRLFRFLSPM